MPDLLEDRPRIWQVLEHFTQCHRIRGRPLPLESGQAPDAHLAPSVSEHRYDMVDGIYSHRPIAAAPERGQDTTGPATDIQDGSALRHGACNASQDPTFCRTEIRRRLNERVALER